ncbi:MAG TPA: hypothetical protein VE028_04220 [Nitratidesulfovibrio sp.]|nr:hypothetical protein [Nitratidesulfovibrio sp.]
MKSLYVLFWPVFAALSSFLITGCCAQYPAAWEYRPVLHQEFKGDQYYYRFVLRHESVTNQTHPSYAIKDQVEFCPQLEAGSKLSMVTASKSNVIMYIKTKDTNTNSDTDLQVYAIYIEKGKIYDDQAFFSGNVVPISKYYLRKMENDVFDVGTLTYGTVRMTAEDYTEIANKAKIALSLIPITAPLGQVADIIIPSGKKLEFGSLKEAAVPRTITLKSNTQDGAIPFAACQENGPICPQCECVYSNIYIEKETQKTLMRKIYTSTEGVDKSQLPDAIGDVPDRQKAVSLVSKAINTAWTEDSISEFYSNIESTSLTAYDKAYIFYRALEKKNYEVFLKSPQFSSSAKKAYTTQIKAIGIDVNEIDGGAQALGL